MVKFQLIRMSSYAKNKLQMCWVIQRQCRSRQMWKIFINSPRKLTFYLLQKMTWLDWTIHSWHALNSLVCPLMLRTNNRCIESLNISVMSPNVENIHKFTHYTDYLSITKKNLSSLNNLFMVMFQLIRMSSYAKNKLHKCWVTQHQCRSRQIWKIFTNSPSTLTFVSYKKWLVLPEQFIHGKVWTH